MQLDILKDHVVLATGQEVWLKCELELGLSVAYLSILMHRWACRRVEGEESLLNFRRIGRRAAVVSGVGVECVVLAMGLDAHWAYRELNKTASEHSILMKSVTGSGCPD